MSPGSITGPKNRASPMSKEFKILPSAGKVMLTVFRDSGGVILVDFLQKGATITFF